jgi:hypothetical protein
MPSPITSGSVMDRSASLLNDTAKSIFTYVVQLPYLNMAQDELSEVLEQNNVPATNEKSSILVVTTAMTDIGGLTGPALPSDLIEVRGAYERLSGSSEDFQIMSRVDFLPPFTQLTESLIYWTWQQQIIYFLGATSARDVRLDYLAVVMPTLSSTTGTDNITLFNAKSFLSYRTAALCAEFVGENTSRAQELNEFAQMALDRFLSINTKGRQSSPVRRRPFMASAKVRSGF